MRVLGLSLHQQLLSSANLTFPAGIFSLNLSLRNGPSWKGEHHIGHYRSVLNQPFLPFSWFWNDLSKTHLLWIKLIFFFQSGSLVVLYPYLVIHMRSLGLSVEEAGLSLTISFLTSLVWTLQVALVNGVIPVADIIGPPMAGFLADKIGNFRWLWSWPEGSEVVCCD